jgi:membrane-associated phospholipid phosphatase
MVSPSGELRLFDAAAIFAAAFIVIGLTFARKPWPSVDRLGSLASGKALPLAIVFTRSGYTPVLTIVAIAGATVAIALRANFGAPAMLIALQLIGQFCAGGAKRFVARLRPEVWHFRRELGFAYPSGHAVTAMMFYPAWAAIAQRWPIPPALHVAALALAALWALGIGWSRLALGAHRLTDVLGGYSLGAALLCVFLAIF